MKKIIERAVRESINRIVGGEGDGLTPDDVDPRQLRLGTEVEREHTDDPEEAEEIAIDHYAEDKKYYDKLAKCGLADELSKEDLRESIRESFKKALKSKK